MTSTISGITAIANHPIIAIFSFSLALIYTSFVGGAVLTALRSDDNDRRNAAIQVLTILTGSKGLSNAKPPARQTKTRAVKPP